ncbi:MAG TPA: hypothetical protein VG756_17785 [Pseudonocardiaceae bacterium]|nr:hypothetical protein [Pseudonocardiaceae bacterium]
MLSGLPNGVWAMLDGRSFRSSSIKPDGTVRLAFTGDGAPDHPAFRRDPATGAWRAVLPAPHCHRLISVSTHATHRGLPCTVSDLAGHRVDLEFGGADADARRLGFARGADGTHRKQVDFAELANWYQVHRDLLFGHWQRRTFGFTLWASNWRRHTAEHDLPPTGYPAFRTGIGTEGAAIGSALVEISVCAAYRGEDYAVPVMGRDGRTLLRKDGGDGSWALDQGFRLAGPHRWEKQVPAAMLYAYRETHRNLLFDQWLAR